MQLTAVDWGVIALYVVLVLGVGLAFRRRAGTSLAEFFVSGRKLPWWLAGTSMVATTFAADTPLAVTGLVAAHGVAGNWVWWSLAVGGMVTVFVYARLWRRAEVLTDVELIELRYAGRPAAFLRGFRAVYVALLVNSIVIGWVTVAMVTVLRHTVLAGGAEDALSDWTVIAGLLAVVGVYAALSGMWGVVVTDFVQFFLAMAGCVALAWIAVDAVGGTAALREQVAAGVDGGEQAFRYLPDFSAEDPWMALDVFLILVFVQWWASWYPGAEPGGGGYVVQRMAACKDERHAVLATLWYQVAHYCLRPWPWILVALCALALHPELRESGKPEVGFPMLMRELAPPGLRGLLLVAFGAAFMSTISTQMNWGASYLVNDVYKRFLRRDAGERELARTARLASVLVLAIGGVTAFWMRDTSVEDAWRLLLALGAGTGLVYMARWFWWRINAWSEIAAMVASLGWFLLADRLVEAPERRTALVAALTIPTWLAVTFLTKPEDERVLCAFYRKVRPGGPGWRPMARIAREVRPDGGLARSVVAALCAAGAVYAAIPAVGDVVFGEYLRGVGLGAVAAGLGAVACRLGIRAGG